MAIVAALGCIRHVSTAQRGTVIVQVRHLCFCENEFWTVINYSNYLSVDATFCRLQPGPSPHFALFWKHYDKRLSPSCRHSPFCQILLQMMTRALIIVSPPACSSSAGMLSTPTDFAFFRDRLHI